MTEHGREIEIQFSGQYPGHVTKLLQWQIFMML